ncbi:MAG: threonine synthase [Bacteroidales bacterium]|nr:threonine synthase [Bacteroidales bacterium]MCF8404715.1 threonine synthase [Bacteroidales bacterium]
MGNKFTYKCTTCSKKLNANKILYLCPDCSTNFPNALPPKGVLKVNYNYDDLIKVGISFSQLKQKHWLDLLPINNLKSLPNLRIGDTPLYHFDKLGKEMPDFDLYVKDDSQNPTFSFKDRASAVVSAFAKEKGIDTIVTASTGNAGSSLAGICAAQGQKAIVMVPASAPIAKLTQIIMYGATIVPVKGTYDDAFDLSVRATAEFGWYNRNTAFNPLTIEGKKTVSFEMFDQLGKTIPDRIFVPVGDGVIISGVYKGFEDLLKLGIIDHMPTIIAVQASGSDNLVRNLENEVFRAKPSHTLADSISVDYPRNFYMARDFLKKYKGEWVTVSDEEILEASKKLASTTGLFAEPAAVATFAGMLKYKKSNKIPEGSKNLVLLTGSGLKDIKSLEKLLKIPEAIEPGMDELKKLIKWNADDADLADLN